MYQTPEVVILGPTVDSDFLRPYLEAQAAPLPIDHALEVATAVANEKMQGLPVGPEAEMQVRRWLDSTLHLLRAHGKLFGWPRYEIVVTRHHRAHISVVYLGASLEKTGPWDV